jgi:hypothetical protein
VKISRRQLLAATGLAAGSLFLPSRRARAQTAPPKRLIVVFTQHGTVYDNWKMRPNGAVDGTAFDVDLTTVADTDFSPILAPLAPFKDKLLVVDGLSMASAEADVTANGHDVGTPHAHTAKKMASGAGGGPSIDQLVAQQIRASGRIDSLELAVVQALNGGAVWRDAGQSLPADASASSVFNRVFPPPVTSGAVGDDDVVRAEQPSVLDLVQSEYDAIAPRLSGADRAKLELHRDLVRAVEQRIVDLANVQCTRPDAPVVDDTGGSAAFYESRADAMFHLTAAALACDLTRVVTIQMGQLFTSNIGAPPGDVHADYAHQVEVNPNAKSFMTTYHTVHAQQFASLLALLDAIPEDGGTLLDSCAVVWVSELADGVHHYRPWSAVVAGGAMRAGRYVNLAIDTPNPSVNTSFPGYQPLIGPPHNRFWLSVAKSVGAEIPVVGETSLTTPDGHVVDCTGPLEELA